MVHPITPSFTVKGAAKSPWEIQTCPWPGIIVFLGSDALAFNVL